MASEQTFSAQDFRAATKDYKRAHDQKHKWALGQVIGNGLANPEGKIRPLMPPSVATTAALRFRNGRDQTRAQTKAKTAQTRDILSEQSESSADESIDEPSAAPEPDAGITYSFDAPQGPSQGSQILTLAIAQAVERFESKQTDKLIKEEYEVLDEEGASNPRALGRKRHVSPSGGEEADVEADDFVVL
ncbi:hypothetical protein W97_03879 [Coniosporium apollinis CBS 100218]|uniref:Uncharacterized protein n=1 Tax=Coniosporium apollinis (strain CBS 100218) TaxID=1168221 RepID=R7YSN7_CONA1|nr:uncharacterized protein W97_03879 [Coniosporium apollinis CBS 100218]EON64646.1 hypothetical protein W97_03879 [Coniosporium apollinis CBS 100218]